jgi:hypothetical protein
MQDPYDIKFALELYEEAPRARMLREEQADVDSVEGMKVCVCVCVCVCVFMGMIIALSQTITIHTHTYTHTHTHTACDSVQRL